MAKLRLSLPLALALLLSLIGDPGACCAIAGGRGGQTAQQGQTASGGLSGIGVLPGGGDTAAVSGKSERLAAGVLEALPARTPGGLSPTAVQPASRPELAASTPLYLSHCAWLC